MFLRNLEGHGDLVRLSALVVDQPAQALLRQRGSARRPWLAEGSDHQPSLMQPLHGQLNRERIGTYLLRERPEVHRDVRRSAQELEDRGVEAPEVARGCDCGCL